MGSKQLLAFICEDKDILTIYTKYFKKNSPELKLTISKKNGSYQIKI
jgi:hypothetical protein